MPKDVMVYQANYLINHRESMGRDENRLFLSLVSQIGKDDNLLTYRIPVSVFAQTWGINKRAVYYRVKDALDALLKKGIRIETVNGSGKKVAFGCGFISDYVYIEGEAVAEVSISAKFKPYLLELKKAYTGYKLEQVIALDAAGAGYTTIRIFELCSEWEYKGEFSYLVPELKKVIDIKDKYPKIYDFKRYVLEPAKKLINGCTNLEVDYTVTGRGEKAKISFTVKRVEVQPETFPNNDPAPVPVPELPDLPEAPELEPLPDFDPYGEELPEGDAFPNPREECLEFVREELKKLPNYQFTEEEVELLLEYCFQNGCMNSVEVSDYARVSVAYIRVQWVRVRYKSPYIRNVFRENHGGWTRFS